MSVDGSNTRTLTTFLYDDEGNVVGVCYPGYGLACEACGHAVWRFTHRGTVVLAEHVIIVSRTKLPRVLQCIIKQ